MEHLKCSNASCSGKFYRKLEIMVKAFGIENIGIKVAEELVEHLDLTRLGELFDCTVEDFLKVPRYQVGMATKLYDSVQAVRAQGVQWHKFIQGIQIDRIGEGTAVEVARAYKNLESFLATTAHDLSIKVPRYTTDSTSKMVQSIQSQMDEILNLATKVEIKYQTDAPKPATAPTETIICVVTGGLKSGSRPDFQRLYGANFGVKWASSVSSNTDYLVTNETANTGKYREAKNIMEKGGKIKIITEAEFLTLLGVEDASHTENKIHQVTTATASNPLDWN
jgi:DNA ligase (NAD+)